MALRELRINNVAVIEQATVSLDDGFVVLTGETGAGKSVCLQALRAALGEKIDAGLLRNGAASATVSAVFDEPPGAVTDVLVALGIEVGDLLTVTREITPSRSSFRVNGALVPAAVVKQIAAELVEITAQGVSARIYRHDWQRALIDRAGGAGTQPLLDEVRRAMQRRGAAQTKLDAAQANAQAGAGELAQARQVVEDVGHLKLEIGERELLFTERGRLRHAASIGLSAHALHQAISGDDGALGVVDTLTRAVSDADAVREFSAEVDTVCSDVDAVIARLREIGREARRAGDTVVVDAQRLAEVEERLDVIARVERRFGSVEAALEELSRAEELLASNADPGKVVEQARQELETAQRDLAVAAAALSRARRATAKSLQKDVTANLRLLDLPHARFAVEISQSDDAGGVEIDGRMVRCTGDGADDIDFRLSTNKDSVPMPIGAGPSGGELSRLVLALGAVVSDSCPTLVLDEVDAGVGGETAAHVGEMLAAMGERRQVVAITHRAEIAARAGAHLQASKAEKAGRATTTVSIVDGDSRIEEMARLLSGRQTAAARSRAAELLAEGGQSEAS
jgi:DNA repair protein RecN (Recombination protein N)